MQKIPLMLAVLACVLFTAVSGTMNSLFLASLGRTQLEAALFAGISVGADIGKAVLPVALAAALSRRLWMQVLLSGVLLTAMVGLSIASGIGFAATTRTATAGAQEDQGARRERMVAELAQIEARRAGFASLRPVSAVEADLKVAHLQRAWAASASCRRIETQAVRRFCEGVAKLDGELAALGERDRSDAARLTLVAALERIGAPVVADPQVSALAAVIGAAEGQLRSVLTVGLAIVVDLGTVGLMLIVAGPALRELPVVPVPRVPPPAAATIPVMADRAQWQREQARRKARAAEGDGHDA